MTKSNPNIMSSFRVGDMLPLIDELALKEDTSRAAIVRRALREYFYQDTLDDSICPLSTELRRLRDDLKKVGLDLNRITHAFNISERMLDLNGLSIVHKNLQVEFDRLKQFLEKVRDVCAETGWL